jgi:hypothetical protein
VAEEEAAQAAVEEALMAQEAEAVDSHPAACPTHSGTSGDIYGDGTNFYEDTDETVTSAGQIPQSTTQQQQQKEEQKEEEEEDEEEGQGEGEGEGDWAPAIWHLSLDRPTAVE